MLTQSLRPQKLSQMVGNDLNKELIRAIAKNPDDSPSTIVMHGAFGCVASYTPLVTSLGLITIKDLFTHFSLNPHSRVDVLTPKGPRRILGIYETGTKPVLNLTLKSGHTLSVSPDHNLLSILPSGEVTYIKAQDSLSRPLIGSTSLLSNSVVPINNTLHFLKGILYRSLHSNKLRVPIDKANTIADLLHQHNIPFKAHPTRRNNVIFEVSPPSSLDLSLLQYFRAPTNYVTEFIKGTFYLSGHSFLSIAQQFSSPTDAQLYSLFLFYIGIRSNIQIIPNKSPSYRVYVLGGKSLHRIRTLLRISSKEPLTESVYYPHIGLRVYSNNPTKLNSLSSDNRVSRHMLLKNWSRLSISDKIGFEPLVSSDTYVDYVTSISTSTEETYDLTVEETNNYLINGIITHNCGKCVDGKTYVLAPSGYKHIEDLIPPINDQKPYTGTEQLLTSSGWVTPSDIYHKSNSPTVTLKTVSGYTLTGTPDHKVLCLAPDLSLGFVPLKNLSPGNTILKYCPTMFFAGKGTPLLDTEWYQFGQKCNANDIHHNLPTLLTLHFDSRVSFLVGHLSRYQIPLKDETRHYLSLIGPDSYLQDIKVIANSCLLHPDLTSKALYFYNKSCAILGSWANKMTNGTDRFATGPASPVFAFTDQNLTFINKHLQDLHLAPYQDNRVDLWELKSRILSAIPDARGLIAHPLYKALQCFQYEQDVITQMYSGNSDVYDFTVPGCHDFYSNGFLSHNTTSARLLARALNCEHFTDDLCGTCPACTADLDSVPFYTEYDVTAIGNVDTIRDLRDTFFYEVPNHHRVIVLDEAHASSSKAQAALLKVFEEAPKRVHFILATTDPEKLLPTIRSRALEMNFTTQSTSAVEDNIRQIAQQKNITISEESVHLIAIRSKGHMRNAHMLLDQYLLVGEESFKTAVRDSTMDVLRLLVALRRRNKDGYFRAVDVLLSYPLADIMEDFQQTLLSLLKCQMGLLQDETLAKVAAVYGKDLLPIIRICTQDWMLSSFANDITLQTALLALYQVTAPAAPTQQATNRNVKS